MARTYHSRRLPPSTKLIVAVFALITGAIIGFANLPAARWNRATQAQSDLFPGFTVAPKYLAAQGLIVTSLETDGLAARSGVAVGDEVEAIDARPMGSLAAASDYLRHDPNTTVRIRLLHNDSIRDVTLRRNGTDAHGA